MIVSAPYAPSDEALKFIAFLRATGNEDNASPEFHYRIADALFSDDKKDWNLVIECLRGAGKSSLVEYATIYVTALGFWPGFGPVSFIAFLGASQDGNVKQFFKNVANKIERSNFLRSLITVTRQTENELEMSNADGKLMYIIGKGMNQNFRGLRSSGKGNSGQRPTVVIADDVSSDEVMTSEAVRSTIETNWFSSVLPALDPKRHKVIYIATPLMEEDLLHKLKRSGVYRVEQFPLCEKFPVEEEDFKSVWPDRFSYEYAANLYTQYLKAGKAQSFYREFLLDVTDLSTLLVEEDDIRWFEPKLLMKNKHLYNFYVSTDFATSEKKSADYSTIGVWAIGSDGSWFLVDGQCKRQSMMENLEDLFRYAHKWKPLSVGIESSGQQGGFLSIITDMMMQKNTWFQLAKKRGSKDFGIRPTKDKTTRFVTGVQPMFKQGKVWFPKPELIKHQPYLLALVEEMVNELSKFTLAGGVKSLAHDDCIDLMNQLSEMDTFTPDDSLGEDGKSVIDEDGHIWTSVWADLEPDEYKSGSTVF